MEQKWTLDGFGDGKSEAKLCSICGAPYGEFGHNALPVNEGRACDRCNRDVVIPARMVRIGKGLSPY